uniref:ParB/RepB/Spo0J family partition protein n=1 Tax=Paracoccus sp. TRP TaxID=412597 RepID=UPI000225F556|nr:ParB/RepB/Spo0J family partition protein [Paracoccus sp. TRP]
MQAIVENVPFADLYLSELNPRTVLDPAGIEALAANIRELGLIQNLGGLRDESGKVGVIFGGRRYRALAMLQDDPRFTTVPVRIAPDASTAELWATSENHQREQPHPADEIREYGAMSRKGASVPAIALAFGVTEAHIYRRLKLASLPAPVLDALKDNELTLAQAAAFTVSDDEARTLAVLADVRGRGIEAEGIKRRLKSEAILSTDRRAVFVGRDAYEAAGGRLTTDLFGDDVYFEDEALLDELFAAKLAETVEALCADGWKWAEASPTRWIDYSNVDNRKFGRVYAETPELTEEQAERYDELAELAENGVLDDAGEEELAALDALMQPVMLPEQKALSGVIFCVDYNGRLETVTGLVKPEDHAAAIEAGYMRQPVQRAQSASEAGKSPISQTLRDDLTRVLTGARQHAALRDPDLLLDLLAYQLTGRMGYRSAFGIRTDDVPNFPTTGAEGYELDARLTTPAERPDDPFGSDLAKGFRAFRKKGRDYVMGELTRHLAALLTGADSKLRSLIDKEVNAHVREVWTPTAANFWTRVSGAYRQKIWCDLLNLKDDHPTATTFAKLKKAEQAERLEKLFSDPAFREAHGVTDKQAERIAKWFPEEVK